MAASRAKGALPLPLLPLRSHPLRPRTLAWAVGRCLFAYDVERSVWEQSNREAHSDAIRALHATVLPQGPGSAESNATVYWLSAGDDKQVAVWNDSGSGSWQRQRDLTHSKKIVAALFDPNGEVLFADRFGDVYRWNLHMTKADEGCAAEPQLLFSHLAIVTAMVMTESGRFIITGDNHEKIRVTCYPQAAEIHSFCLGHLGQITSLACVGDEAVVSTSSDCTLRVWRLEDGEQILSCSLGAAATSICRVAENAVVVCCEAAPGLRHVSFDTPGFGAVADVLPLSQEAPQVVSVMPVAGSSNQVVWVDRGGHLRYPLASGNTTAEWGKVSVGEDLPPALVSLSKFTDPDCAEEVGGGDDDDQTQPRKRRPK